MIGSIVSSIGKYASLLEGVPLQYLVLAVFLYYLSVFVYSLRWKLVLRGVGKDASLVELTKALMAGLFVNNVTPTSRSGGELLRAAWISYRPRVPFGISTVTVLYERLLEVIPFLFMMLLGVLYFLPSKLPMIVALFLISLLVWFKWDFVVKLVLKLLKTELSDEDLKKLFSLQKSPLTTFGGILLSSAVWILDVLRLKVITMAFGLSLGCGIIVAISVINLILGMAAITPGGIGIVEGGLVGAMIHLGIPQAFAVLVTLLERFVSYFLGTITGLGVMLLSGGFEIWRALKSR
jgi:uncharacterized protein (TIRG00374 family)